jgi:hypothetical protein
MPAAQKPAAAPAADDSRYPGVERFIERASAEDVAHAFSSVREGLTGLKGPKADQAKKVTAAVERAEELFGFLLEVRERMLADKKGSKKR